MLVYTNQTIPKQPPESDYGNKEYKIFLSPYNRKNKKRKKNLPQLTFQNYIENKSSQLLFRLIEGNGKAVYLLGIKDDGNIRGMTDEEMKFTLQNLNLMIREIGAHIRIIRVYNGGIGNVCAVRLYLPEDIYHKKIKDSII